VTRQFVGGVKIIAEKLLVPYIYTFVTRTKGESHKEKLINFLLSGYVAGSTIPFFLAHLVYVCLLLKLNYYQAMYDFGLFVLGYLILLPIYELGYLINDVYSIKFEEKNRKTIRVKYELIPFRVLVLSIFVRLLISFLLWWLFIPDIYKTQTLGILLLILLVFTIHNLIRVEIRTATTFPMLRFLRILLVFIPIIKTQIEWILFALYSFSYIIPNLTIYVAKKLGDGEKNITKNLKININLWYLLSIIFSFTILSTSMSLINNFRHILELISFIVVIQFYCLFAILVNIMGGSK